MMKNGEGEGYAAWSMSASSNVPAGSYSLSGLSPGSYAVSFTMAGYSTQTLLVEVAAGATVTRNVTMQLSNGSCP